MVLLSRPCRVKIKPSYYTVPPLDECDGLVEDGTCVVENFTIGRTGYGEVHFPGKTDIFGLDLESIGMYEHWSCD